MCLLYEVVSRHPPPPDGTSVVNEEEFRVLRGHSVDSVGAVKGAAVFSSPWGGGLVQPLPKASRLGAASYKAPLYVTLRSPSGKTVR